MLYVFNMLGIIKAQMPLYDEKAQICFQNLLILVFKKTKKKN